MIIIIIFIDSNINMFKFLKKEGICLKKKDLLLKYLVMYSTIYFSKKKIDILIKKYSTTFWKNFFKIKSK